MAQEVSECVGRFRRGSAGCGSLALEADWQYGEGCRVGDVVALVRVEVDAEGFPCLPRWAATAAGLREDQRRLVVLGDGRIALAHLVPGGEPLPVRGTADGAGPEPPEPTPAA